MAHFKNKQDKNQRKVLNMKPTGKWPIRRPRLRQEQLGKKDVIYKSMGDNCEGKGLQRQSQTAFNARQHQSRSVKGRNISLIQKNVLQTSDLQVHDHHIPLKTAFDVSDSADLP